MSRQRHPILRVLMWITVVPSQLCAAQVCRVFNSASAEEAIRSLDRGEIHDAHGTHEFPVNRVRSI